jgi:hypothetical protein
MSILGAKFVDLIDIYKKQNPDGTAADIIQMLSEMNPILDDALAMECNQGTRHLHSVQTGLPAVTWGKLYQGILQSKGTQAQVTDTTGFVEGLSTIDSRLLRLAKNPGNVRLTEGRSFLEAISQEVATRLFYGNTASDPEQFMGFAPRFNDKNAPNGNQIIDAGGTDSDNTSIWFVTWGDSQCHLLYPEGTQGGVEREDKGEQRVEDAAGNPYFAMEEMFTWNVGLAVKDWRYVSRIANIDVSDMAGGAVALYDFMRKAFYQLQNRRVAGGSLAIYCNRDVLEALDALATNAGTSDSFVRLKPMEIEGKEVMTYRGIPIRETDALINTEERVIGL